MKGLALALALLTGCTTGALRPWPQAAHQDEPTCLAACERHAEECPQIFAAYPERGAVECPASHADCVRSCKGTTAAAASAPPPVSTPPPPLNHSKEAKLRELKRLYEEGLVTDEVYKARQLAILSEP